MKNKYGFVAILLAVILFAGMGLTELYVSMEEGEATKDITIVTSFYPMYIAALNVVGDCDNVTLENLSEPQTGCLHDYQLTPADMKLLSTADVFIVNGGGIESFLSDVAAQYPGLTIINASADVPLIEEEEGHTHDHDAEAEDEHEHAEDEEEAEHEHAEEAVTETVDDTHTHEEAAYNAHAWMNIADYMTQIQTISSELAAIDTANAKTYETNADTYQDKLLALQDEAAEVATETAGQDIVIFHEAYDYVAEMFGMNVVYTMDLDEERQVSAGEVADVIAEIEEHSVKTVLAEELYGGDMGNTVMSETEVQVVYLDTMVRGDYDADSYLNAMESNIHLIKEAFSNEEDH